jgi:prophage antirepressor-like protein
MANNRTFTELNGNCVTSKNGKYSVRYVMENDSPRFVLVDVMRNLGYKNLSVSTNQYCKKFDLGKVVGSDNKLRTYADKEQMEQILACATLASPEFRKFWEEEVVPKTDVRCAALRKEVDEAKEKNQKLEAIYETLSKRNGELVEKIEELLKARKQIEDILGKIA